jgi:predicted small lipoprotein YifL
MLLALFLFGCGQSGPLYVSGNPSSVEPASGQTDSDEEDEQDGESSTEE